ncbi:MAG: O-antigen ligase family protein [Oscillospiraceae bacterium]|nr:O-antigen ligase family protein [Oscillospiraceae bacterium]
MSKTAKNAANFVERKISAMYLKIDIWQNRVARLLFILMCCGVPLYFNQHGYLGLPEFKWHFYMFSIILTMIFVVAIWVYRLIQSPRLLPQFDFNVVDWAVVGFAAITLISTLFSPFSDFINVWVGMPGQTGRFDGAITQLSYVAIFFIISRWYKPREKDFMWFCVASIVISLIGIFQFFGMDFFGFWPNHMPEHFRENFFHIHIRTTIGNTNTVSLFVTLAILFSGFLFIRKPSKWQPLWLVTSAMNFWMWVIANADSGTVGLSVAMLLCIPFIIQNIKTLGRTLILISTWVAMYILQTFFFEVVAIETRVASSLLPFAAIFTLLLIIGLVLTLRGKELNPDAPPRWKLGVILIIVIIAAGLVGVEVMGRPNADGMGTGIIYEAREIMHGRIQDEFGTNRIYIWRHALSSVPNRLLIGHGPDTFIFAFPREAQGYFGETYDTAHNEYIQYLVAQGVLGLIAYLVFAVGVVVLSVRKAFKDPIIMAVLAAFVAYLAQAFFNISHPIASQILWVFAGILVSRRLSKGSET